MVCFFCHVLAKWIFWLSKKDRLGGRSFLTKNSWDFSVDFWVLGAWRLDFEIFGAFRDIDVYLYTYGKIEK
ncbi:MAG: hypothetical protein PHR61_04515 [Candidatus Absconditabacteria bacterium]|nr:hypothetical protein [Candidatus Absconditabacteria bacterium]